MTDVGFYSELPEDCVRKIRPGREAEQLAPVLRELIHDEGLRRSMGARGRQFSEATFRADRYAEGILELAAELGPALPYLQLADRMGRHLADMGVGGGHAAGCAPRPKRLPSCFSTGSLRTGSRHSPRSNCRTLVSSASPSERLAEEGARRSPAACPDPWRCSRT